MSPLRAFTTGMGARQRQSHMPPISGPKLQVQAPRLQLPAYPFQPLPPPNGPAPFRYDLSNLLAADDVKKITDAGVLVFHSVGDTGYFRGEQMDFVEVMELADGLIHRHRVYWGWFGVKLLEQDRYHR